jgi:hypothetical protein
MGKGLENKFAKLIKALEESTLTHKKVFIAEVYEIEIKEKIDIRHIKRLNELYKLAKANKHISTFAELWKKRNLEDFAGMEFTHKFDKGNKTTYRVLKTMSSMYVIVNAEDYGDDSFSNIEYTLAEIKANLRAKIWIIQN